MFIVRMKRKTSGTYNYLAFSFLIYISLKPDIRIYCYVINLDMLRQILRLLMKAKDVPLDVEYHSYNDKNNNSNIYRSIKDYYDQ